MGKPNKDQATTFRRVPERKKLVGATVFPSTISAILFSLTAVFFFELGHKKVNVDVLQLPAVVLRKENRSAEAAASLRHGIKHKPLESQSSFNF